MSAASTPLVLFRFENLSRVPGIEHAVSTRSGGVSEGRCASLNTSFSVGDAEQNVEENLRRLAAALGTERERLYAPYQVHGNTAVVVDANSRPGPRSDVLVTASPARTLMLRFADCTPILLVDPTRGVVAGIHAGWRGTAVRAAHAAVEAMVHGFGTNPRDVLAGIGPAIGPCCYTVGPEVVDAFADRPWAVVHGGDETRLDLWEANRRGLVAAGVPPEQVEVAGICTRCQADRFFSHRANQGQPAGRFAALIRLTS